MSWCAAHGFASLRADSEVVALYLTDYVRAHKASTLVRRAVGVANGHRRAGYLSLTEVESVRLVLAGIRHTTGMAPTQKSPLLTADVLALIDKCRPYTLAGERDRGPAAGRLQGHRRVGRALGRCAGRGSSPSSRPSPHLSST